MNDDVHAGQRRYTLKPESGGLQVGSGDLAKYAIRPHREGWITEGRSRPEALRLVPGDGGGLALQAGPGEGDRLATFSPAGTVAGSTILTADGDLFRIRDRAGPDPGYDLAGWQGGGPYFSTAGSGESWSLVVHPAGDALLGEDRGEAVLLTFIAVTAGLAAVDDHG